MAQRTLRIGLTGGGSGGHMYPLLAVAEEVRAVAALHGLSVELCYFGSSAQYEPELKDLGIRTIPIAAAKMRRYSAAENFLDIPRFFQSVVQAWWRLYAIMPDVLFSKGGSGSFPVVFMAWFYRIPVIIHESDAEPGLSNLLSSRFASRIAISFERAAKYFNPKKTFLSGNPVRRKLLASRAASDAAKQELGFAPDKPLVLVIGGSQGAQRINEFIALNLLAILKEVQLLHQTGPRNFIEMKKLTQTVLFDTAVGRDLVNRYKAVPYLENDLAMAYAAADVVVSRAGSGVLSEVAAFGKPGILIPIRESANDHQRANAYEFAKSGAGIVIEEPNLLPGIFLGQLKTVLQDRETMQKMSMAAVAFAKPRAAETVAEEVLNLALRVRSEGRSEDKPIGPKDENVIE